MSKCSCEKWIQGLPIPGKVIIFKCSICRTAYTLYPNGQIAFEQNIEGGGIYLKNS